MKQETVLKIIRAETSFVKESGFVSYFFDSGFFMKGNFFDELLVCNNPKIKESLHLFLEVLVEQFDEMVKSAVQSFQSKKREIIDKIRNGLLAITVESKHKLVDELVNLFNLVEPNSIEVNRIFFFIFLFLSMITIIHV